MTIEVQPTEAPNEQVPANTTVPDTTVPSVVPGEQTTPPGGDTPTPVEQPVDLPPAEVPAPQPYFYAGQQVQVEVPADVREELTGKGIDIDAVVGELYKEGGEFTLSEETKEKLYKAYGSKMVVDSYLAGLKAQNDLTLRTMADDKAAAEHAEVARVAADAALFEDLCKPLGGEEGWGKLEAWSQEHLTDEAFAEFNAIMGSGNKTLQSFAIRELQHRMSVANGDEKATLIESGTPVQESSNGALSALQYRQELMALGAACGNNRKEYQSRLAILDERRRKGMASGT